MHHLPDDSTPHFFQGQIHSHISRRPSALSRNGSGVTPHDSLHPSKMPPTGILRPTSTYSNSSHHLREAIREIVDDWDELSTFNDLDPVPPCPVTIDASDRERHQADYTRRTAYHEAVQELVRRMELGVDASVGDERYKEVKGKHDKFKVEWDEKEKGGPYSFQDGAPSWFVGS